MAADTAERLKNCFRAVFPALSENSIETASPATVTEWDSIQHVTLVNVIEEEFGISIDMDALDELNSYKAFLQYLEAHRS